MLDFSAGKGRSKNSALLPAGPSETDMQFKVRRAVIGDEPVLRALRLQALTDSPGAFSSPYERELPRTTEDWQRWLAPGARFVLDAVAEPLRPRATVPASHAFSPLPSCALRHPRIPLCNR